MVLEITLYLALDSNPIFPTHGTIIGALLTPFIFNGELGRVARYHSPSVHTGNINFGSAYLNFTMANRDLLCILERVSLYADDMLLYLSDPLPTPGIILYIILG